MHDQTKPIAVNEYPSKRHVAARGALLGIASGLIGSGLLTVIYTLVTYTTMNLRDFAGGQADPPGVAVLLLVASCAVTLPVGGAVGMLLAIYLRWYGTNRELTPRRGAFFGAISGFVCTSTLVAVSFSMVLDESIFNSVDQSVLLVGAVFAIAGAWHGWQMARWLERQQELLSGSDSET